MMLFKKKDPVCGMKEEKGKGQNIYGKWFCSKNCIDKFEKNMPKSRGCC